MGVVRPGISSWRIGLFIQDPFQIDTFRKSERMMRRKEKEIHSSEAIEAIFR